MMTTIKQILAIDDTPVFLNGLEDLIQHKFPDYTFRKAHDFEAARELLRTNTFDLVLLDLDLRNAKADGFSVARYLRQHHPELKIIILTSFIKIDYIEELFGTGLVDAYLDKNFDTATLYEAITMVQQGEQYLPEELKTTIERGRWYKISEREREVLNLLAKGMTKKEIAEHVFLSPHTIDTHVRNLFDKFSVKSSQELVGKYTSYLAASTENKDEISPFKT